ncbi:MAG: hypothetical protein ACJ708_08145 [Nitrososphaeraceae archaeon]
MGKAVCSSFVNSKASCALKPRTYINRKVIKGLGTLGQFFLVVIRKIQTQHDEKYILENIFRIRYFLVLHYSGHAV